jgi:TolB-like protein/cytochrome c-type biogenesis protein CcmH/NrfG
VLPFTFRGVDDALEILAEDLTEDVTRALAENDYFPVIAAGTMAAWRGKARDYRMIGRELDARYLVEGKLQRAGDVIRLTMQLIDAETANAVWSHRFALSAEEMTNNPEDFPRIVASELAENLMQVETRRAMAKTGSYSAWEHILRSRAFAFRGPDGVRRSVEEARSAVDSAPDFGLAHATLAAAIVVLPNHIGLKYADTLTGEAREQLTREVREHLTWALQLDGDNPMVIALIASVHSALGDAEAGLRLARRAVELRPNTGRCYFALGTANLVLGRTNEAIAAYAVQLRCKARDYLRAIACEMSGWCYLLEGRPQEADDALDQSLALNPEANIALMLKAIAEALLGKEARALAGMRRLRELRPDMPLDQHIHFMTQNPRLAVRSDEHVAILRRLWEATQGDI